LHPWIEYILATPSNHRVHHGSQEKYINKNYGASFILWDRIFGTYQEEEEQVIYGLTKNIDHKHDPIHINFHEYYEIIADVKSASTLKEKLFFIFGDPGDIGIYKKAKEQKETFVHEIKNEERKITDTPVIEMSAGDRPVKGQKMITPEPELQKAVGE
ncbi:MAG: sterol desaturase family protein, partial [Cyclobacteriaceae bacterium]